MTPTKKKKNTSIKSIEKIYFTYRMNHRSCYSFLLLDKYLAEATDSFCDTLYFWAINIQLKQHILLQYSLLLLDKYPTEATYFFCDTPSLCSINIRPKRRIIFSNVFPAEATECFELFAIFPLESAILCESRRFSRRVGMY